MIDLPPCPSCGVLAVDHAQVRGHQYAGLGIVADPIDAAIASVDGAPQGAPPMRPLVEVPITLGRSGGAVVAVGVPLDITDAEVMDMCSWLLSSLRSHIARNAQPTIVVARGIVDR